VIFPACGNLQFGTMELDLPRHFDASRPFFRLFRRF
jgi:hypothetical protein